MNQEIKKVKDSAESLTRKLEELRQKPDRTGEAISGFRMFTQDVVKALTGLQAQIDKMQPPASE